MATVGIADLLPEFARQLWESIGEDNTTAITLLMARYLALDVAESLLMRMEH